MSVVATNSHNTEGCIHIQMLTHTIHPPTTHPPPYLISLALKFPMIFPMPSTTATALICFSFISSMASMALTSGPMLTCVCLVMCYVFRVIE